MKYELEELRQLFLQIDDLIHANPIPKELIFRPSERDASTLHLRRIDIVTGPCTLIFSDSDRNEAWLSMTRRMASRKLFAGLGKDIDKEGP